MVSIVGSSNTTASWSCLSGVDDFGIGGTQPRKATVSFYSSRPNRVIMEGYNGLWETRPILSTVFLGAGLGTRYNLGDLYYTSS
jgi:hypothetical protein